MEELRVISLFKWGRRLVLVGLLLGLAFLPTQTNAAVLALIDREARALTEKFEKALVPIFEEQAGPKSERSKRGDR